MLGLSGPISSENALTLADILRRTVVIEWFEGVALVRAIIDRLNSSSSSSVPELHQVEPRLVGTSRCQWRFVDR